MTALFPDAASGADAIHPSTRTVRAGIATDPAYGAVVPPPVLSSTFAFEGLGRKRTYDYTRSGNPTRDLLGEALADLEGGAGGVVTSTGLAAVTLVLSLLKPGDRLVVPHDCYGGSWRLFTALAARQHFELLAVDLTDPAQVRAAVEARPVIVWVETPSNPLLRLTDIAAVAAAARGVGALTVVDNTFLSPALQTPLALGADIVVHSTTKYINGHSDVVGGAAIARDPAIHEKLTWWANALGLTGSPFDSYLTLRGLRTLDARMRVHVDNAHAVATALAGHPAVLTVHWPGLPSHPSYALGVRQQRAAGAIVSVELRGGEDGVRAFLGGLRWFTLAESLGGVESLVAHPATMTHLAMSPEAREAAGIGPGLLRLSVGIEHAADLTADVRAAADRVLARAAAEDAA